MSDIDELRQKAKKAWDELHAAEAAERDKENAAQVGRCFKYRNSYGGDRPRWWLYSMVMRVEDGALRVFSFETCCDNKVSIEMSRFIMRITDSDIEISREEFDKAWRLTRAFLSAIVFPVPSPSKTGD